jgi:menaquinone-dependent protoporphyrinogen oxidase
MARVLVVYGSRHGGTRGIAERIGEVLRTEGIEAGVAGAADGPDIRAADAVVVGSGVYMGSWLKEPIAFLEANREALAARPVWLFSSGPLRGSTAAKDENDPMADVLGPADGPGSGGRRKIAELSDVIRPRDHRVFYGAFDPKDPPHALAERLIRMMPGSAGLLPPGDFREWDLIEAWAREIAATLGAKTGIA